MRYVKGLALQEIARTGLVVRFAMAFILFGVAATVPVGSGPLAASVSAQEFPSECGREGQRPCKVWEHIPSCQAGLAEKPVGQRCSRKAPPPRTPSLMPRPEQVAGCGARGEKPCKVHQALPSCEGTLVEDFAMGACRRNDGDFVNMAKNTLREVGPVLRTISLGAVQCGVDSIMFEIQKMGAATTVDRLLAQPCFNALLDQANNAGYRTLTVGGSGGASFIVGAEGENGFAFDTQKRRPVTTYHTLSLKFLSIGAGASVTVGLFKKDNLSFGGDAHGASVGFAAAGGGGAAVWFDYRNDQVQGANAVITAGGRADIAYIRNTTRILPTQYAIQKALVAPAGAACGWPGAPLSANYRRDTDPAMLRREFATYGPNNAVLYYRYSQNEGPWTDWKAYRLVEGANCDNGHVYRSPDTGQYFILSRDFTRMHWRRSSAANADGFTMSWKTNLGNPFAR